MAKKQVIPLTENLLPFRNPNLDTSGRFAIDQLLRDNGFMPWIRKRGKETEWMRKSDRKLFLESEALNLLPKDKVDDAIYARELYYDLLEDEAA